MNKRIISAFLLCAMLTSLAACGGDSDGKDTTDPAQTPVPEEASWQA